MLLLHLTLTTLYATKFLKYAKYVETYNNGRTISAAQNGNFPWSFVCLCSSGCVLTYTITVKQKM